MRRRVAVLMLLGSALLVVGLLGWLLSRRPAEQALEPLRVERKPIGKLPIPPHLRGQDIYIEYSRATFVDFDGDNIPELLAVGEVLNGGVLTPSHTAWLSLKDGATATIPLLALMPSTTNATGDFTVDVPIAPDSLPYAREVIAWDAKVQAPLTLRRTARGWQTQPIDALKGESVQNALGFDADKDGQLDDYLLQTQSGKLAHLQVDSDRRLRLLKVEPTTPTAIQQLFRDVRALSNHLVAGATLLPATIPEQWRWLPDMDGDSGQELIEVGDRMRNQPARLRLSRSQRALPLPFFDYSLSYQVEPVEIEKGTPSELGIVRKLGKSIQVLIYRVKENRLQQATAFTTAVQSEWLPCWLRDLDGDGITEIVIVDAPARSTQKVRWRVFRYERGVFREHASHEWRSPLYLRHLRQPISVQSGLLMVGTHEPLLARFTGGSGEATVLVTMPEGTEALNPARWQFTVLPDAIPLWAGDYDGDGGEELVLGGRFRETYLLQRRGDKVHGAKISDMAASRVLPARIGDTPWLVLLCNQGEVEMVRILTP